MDTATTIDQVRAAVRRERSAGRRVGLVPTMGALHAGHLSLVRLARERADFVIVSVFVNPTQFAPGEDYEAYPRDAERDGRLARSAGCDLLFLPSAAEMYPPGFSTAVRVEGLSGPLCGQHRPGHFDGVALVVTKLLNIVAPDVSVFGQKDAQQALVIRRLARDLHLPGEILVGPTVREADGLAMSSRNRYLSAEERKAALSLSRGLAAAARAWEAGERDPGALQETVRREMDAEPLVGTEYAEIRDLDELRPWGGGPGPALLAVAARVGRARLIDNVVLGASDAAPAAAGGEEGVTERKAMAVVLAAGEGKRMKSDLPKVLHRAAGKALLARVVDAAREAGVDRIVVVVGSGAERVRAEFAGEGWEFVEQPVRLGTGDAVKRARAQIRRHAGEVLVLAGDVPLLKGSTLRALRDRHRAERAAATVLTAHLPDPAGYGRIVRAGDGEFLAIVEHKDADDGERAVDEVNSSIYCFEADDLLSVLDRFRRDNSQGEEYLTDAIAILRGDGKKVAAVAAASPEEILGVNTPDQLREVEEILAQRAGRSPSGDHVPASDAP